MSTQKTRQEIEIADTWDLQVMFASQEEWETEIQKAQHLPENLVQWQGKLGQSSETLLEAISSLFTSFRTIEKIYVYAHLLNDQDLNDARGQELFGRAKGLYYRLSASSSFFEPELLEMNSETLKAWMQEPSFETYRFYLSNIMRKQPFTLSQKEEKLLAMASEPLNATQEIFSMINNVEIPERFPEVTNEKGEKQKLTHASYAKLTESKVREVRRDSFVGMLSSYKDTRQSLCASLQGFIKGRVFQAKAKGYSSALEMALTKNNISLEVYHSLIQAVQQRLPDFYRFMELHKKSLSLADYHLYDTRIPMVENWDKQYSWEEAEQLILASLAPLGDDYISIVKQGFSGRWIDRYENKGKRSGAYSSGCYDSPPYILHNYNGTMNSVFTLMHELGHSVHSYLSRKHQPYHSSSYTIFVAEVASTANEGLLIEHLLRNSSSTQEKGYLLNHYMNDFRGTLFRQTMFAEFELFLYEQVEQGKVLTPDLLDEKYFELTQLYFGSSIHWNEEDRLICHEWARIPHFYFQFYVYQYATGISAATSFVQQIQSEGQPAVDRYLQMLRSGGSDFSLDLLKKAGVDLTTPQPVFAALDRFKNLLNQWEKLSW